MYNLTAIEGNLNLDLSTFLNQITETSSIIEAKQKSKQKKLNLLAELASDYYIKLQEMLDNIEAYGSNFKIKLIDMRYQLDAQMRLEFGHGRAHIQITFKIDESCNFSGEVTYHGIGTFDRNTTKVESVAQIIEFCQAPIKLLMLEELVQDFETRDAIEKTLITYKGD